MAFDRREFLAAGVAAASAAFAQVSARPGAPGPGMPGRWPGRVASVHHPGSFVSGRYQAGPVQTMIERGMCELTGAPAAPEAWRTLFEPGDVVGIKLNPVGAPHIVSAPEVLRTVVAGLVQAGVKHRDIVAYDRYRDQFLRAGFREWLPEGVRWTAASEKYLDVQLDMEGYDRDVYMEMPLVNPAYSKEYSLSDSHPRRSYVAKFLTKEVNKLVNLCVLKHHQAAGVTLALKNLSHGLVNNVNRSHVSNTANVTGTFIPAVVDRPVFRQKAVLHILDGIQGAYHGGPGGKTGKYLWAHHTMYCATDPVALDKTGWKAIDAKRAEVGRPPIALLKPDADSTRLNCQVEHIELAGNIGLGIFDDSKIELRTVRLT
jgi:uncharacterized protein (DUF362 family)